MMISARELDLVDSLLQTIGCCLVHPIGGTRCHHTNCRTDGIFMSVRCQQTLGRSSSYEMKSRVDVAVAIIVVDVAVVDMRKCCRLGTCSVASNVTIYLHLSSRIRTFGGSIGDNKLLAGASGSLF